MGLKNLIRVTLMLIFCFQIENSYSQIEKYIYDLRDDAGKVEVGKIIKYLPGELGGKNIFLLSESNHLFKRLDSIRTQLIKEIILFSNPEKVYYENSLEHQFLLYNYLNGKIDTLEYKDTMQSKYINIKLSIPDKINFPYYEFVRNEYENLINDNYLHILNSMMELNYYDKLAPIDIGTQTIWLGLFHLGKLTSKNNSTNEYINNFIDSIRVNYQWSFSRLGITVDNEIKYQFGQFTDY